MGHSLPIVPAADLCYSNRDIGARVAPEAIMERWTAVRGESVAIARSQRMRWRSLATSFLILAALGCTRSAQVGGSESAARNTPWVSLIDVQTLNGWRVYRGAARPSGWSVNGGVLMKTQPTDDIVTVDQFGDFELELDWRVSPGGNSGLFYRATEEYDKVYWSAAEYAILDDANARDGRNRITSAGAAHSLYAPPAGIVKPANEWNHTRVIARGAHVEHWLNGTKLLEYENGSPEWDAKVKASKFAPYANFGKARRGHIALQGDHGGELQIRNFRIRELK
jgi:hypothetical protein